MNTGNTNEGLTIKMEHFMKQTIAIGQLIILGM